MGEGEGIGTRRGWDVWGGYRRTSGRRERGQWLISVKAIKVYDGLSVNDGGS